jgi:hypothetical protein
MREPVPHDPLVCGIGEGTTCDDCRRRWEAAERARSPHLCKPGPQPWNQLAGTAEEQLRRALGPKPEPEMTPDEIARFIRALKNRPKFRRTIASLLGVRKRGKGKGDG